MVIERETLLKIARDTAKQYLAARRSLVSAYLIGSVAANEPLLGEATDVDLVFIDSDPPLPRTVVRLSDQIALDVQYRAKSDYAHPKDLRAHPWIGPEMAEPIFISDPTHFFELAQSSARGQFHRADYVAARARGFAAWAREELHVGLLPGMAPTAPVTLGSLCRSLMYSANAVITLTGFPGAGRRLVMKLEAAAKKLKRADVYDTFLAVSGADIITAVEAKHFLADWSAAYLAGQAADDELIHPARHTIYERGFRAQLDADRVGDAVWLMLYTWQECLRNLPNDSPSADAWVDWLNRLGIASPAEFTEKVDQARAYAELADAVVEAWAESNGA